MADVFIVSDNILSPLGATTAENFSKLKNNISGINFYDDASVSPQPFYASLFERQNTFIKEGNASAYTKFEQLLIASITGALQNSGIGAEDKETVLIISTTKGNISLLETAQASPERNCRIALTTSARLVAEYFRFVNLPIIVSNACISGVLALLTGMRLIQSGQFKNVVVAGADVVSKFILSGFQSFQAVSPEPCQPFDASRKGITLGEGAGTIVLSSRKKHDGGVKITGGSVRNDANHISGPSRTGEELCGAIYKALTEAHLTARDIDFISAHGTATLYNDEMEAQALALAGLQLVPVNSLKGYFGHTLGAAGLIETIVTTQSMKENLVLPTKGFQQSGVSRSLTISTALQSRQLHNCLKTSSGFGGCNAALVLSKE